MQTSEQWTETDGGWQLGDARGEDHEEGFVIHTFGDHADPETAMTALIAAMRFNKMICIRKTDETNRIIQALTRQKRIQCAPNIGFDFEALGIVAIKPEKPKPGFLARLFGKS